MSEDNVKEIKFYDTNAVLHDLENIKNNKDVFYISSITINELENIKTSGNKDNEVKFEARQAVRFLSKNEDKYNVVIVNNNHYKIIEELKLPITNDNLIIACAKSLSDSINIIFETNDILCNLIAKEFFKLKTNKIKTENNFEKYVGYKEIIMTDEELAKFYELDKRENTYDLLKNEYLIIKDTLNQPLDAWRYNGIELIPLDVKPIKSNLLGKLKAKDFYQQCALDSFSNNQITAITGKAGSGKSYLAMNFLFSQLEKGKIDKIIIFTNPVSTRNSAEIGFLPGSREEKLMESNIGNFLIGKVGDKMQVFQLMTMGKLLLLPISDIRGFDTTNMNAAIYITEAQNMNIDMMKLALQRIGEDCTTIIDGDCGTQVDRRDFEGINNGLRRISEVFKGQDFYGEIELNKIYRSRIAEIADLM